MDDAFDRLKTALADSYALERELGHGGMATVYLAQDLKHRRRVAVKILRPELALALGPERFFHEIEIAARLQHPHILPLHDSGKVDVHVPGMGESTTLFYYVMPFVEGETLRDRLNRSGPLPVQETVRYLAEIADGLAYAHAQGVVHRDMKPDNVIISGRHALIMDFGVAKAISDANTIHRLTTAGMALGTPAYMAPEQAAADPAIDHRADIYALGVIGYELLSGKPPFSDMSLPQILAAHVTVAPEPLLSKLPSCPPVLAGVIMRCLEKLPKDRWATAAELSHQLEAIGTPTAGVAATTRVPAAATAGTGWLRAAAWQRSGYLVLGVVLSLLVAWGVMRKRELPATPGNARRVVVLPFENQGDSSRLYFANGVTEAITTQLTGIAGMSVVPRSTAARYRGTTKSLAEIGKELGVSYVLAGTVQFEEVKNGPSKVRVSPELIRVSDTSSVWAHGYDAELASVFQVYSNVATEVARSLEVALNDPEKEALASRPTASPEAYDLYLRAVDYLNRGLAISNFQTAIPMLRRAVLLDSTFALAWGRLSESLALSHWLYIDRRPEVLAEAESAARTALRLQPDLPESHRAMGNLFYRKREYDKALAELEIVRRHQPNSVDLISTVGYVYRRQGRWEESLKQFNRRVDLDPASTLGYSDLGETLDMMRRYDEATPVLRHCIDLAPDEPDCHSWLVDNLSRRDSSPAAAIGALREALTRVPPGRLLSLAQMPAWLIGSDDSTRKLFLAGTTSYVGRSQADYYLFRGDLLRLNGDGRGARSYYDSARVNLADNLRLSPDDYGWHQRLGQILLRVGELEPALREAKRAVELLPIERDVYFGMNCTVDLARVYAGMGRAADAVALLKPALAAPSAISVNQLRQQPEWDPIRKDPEFQKLLAGR